MTKLLVILPALIILIAPAHAQSLKITCTNNAATATGLVLERCTGKNCTNFVAVATIPTICNYTDSNNLQYGTYYTYRIKAVNATETSDYSLAATNTTIIAQTPDKPKNTKGVKP